jgi:hypothetical protein
MRTLHPAKKKKKKTVSFEHVSKKQGLVTPVHGIGSSLMLGGAGKRQRPNP